MTAVFSLLDPPLLALSLLIALIAGFVKGVVGFAMPLVFISGLTFFISPELALAGLILPTLFTNIQQSLRQGFAAVWRSVRKFWVFLVVGGATLVVAAQFVRMIPEEVMQLTIGLPVVFFALLQLTGYRFHISRKTWKIEATVGGLAGFLGGLSGVWGPPTVSYLTALDTPKHEQMQVQGVIYGAGSVLLFAAHLNSGVLRTETLPFSLMLVVPAFIGMWIGGRVMDRIDQKVFRQATLLVLLLAGANLVRRGLF